MPPSSGLLVMIALADALDALERKDPRKAHLVEMRTLAV